MTGKSQLQHKLNFSAQNSQAHQPLFSLYLRGALILIIIIAHKLTRYQSYIILPVARSALSSPTCRSVLKNYAPITTYAPIPTPLHTSTARSVVVLGGGRGWRWPNFKNPLLQFSIFQKKKSISAIEFMRLALRGREMRIFLTSLITQYSQIICKLKFASKFEIATLGHLYPRSPPSTTGS